MKIWVVAALLVMELGREWGWSSARAIGTIVLATAVGFRQPAAQLAPVRTAPRPRVHA